MPTYRIVTVHEVTRVVRRSYEIATDEIGELALFLPESCEMFAQQEPDLLPVSKEVEFGGQRTESMSVKLLEAAITGLDEHGELLAPKEE